VIRSATPGDSSGPLVPNGPGIPAPAPAPASAPWRDIAPELSAEPYVFARRGPCSASYESRATPAVNNSCAPPACLATMSGSDGRAEGGDSDLDG
jgi:hypothetical protein